MRRDDMAQLFFNAYKLVTGVDLPAGPDAFTDDNVNDNEAAINALAKAAVVTWRSSSTPPPSGRDRRNHMTTSGAREVRFNTERPPTAALGGCRRTRVRSGTSRTRKQETPMVATFRLRKMTALLAMASLLASMAVLVTVSDSSAILSQEWPTLAQNNQRTGFNSVNGVPSDPTQLWHFDGSTLPHTAGGIHTPVMANGLIYVTTDDSSSFSSPVQAGVLALNSGTGNVVWQLATGADTPFQEDVKGAPAVGSDGTVYVAFSDWLVALNGATGAVLWKVDPLTLDSCLNARASRGQAQICQPTLEAFSQGPTVGPDGTIYVPAGSGALAAITPPADPNPATLKWQFQTSPNNECDKDLKSYPAIAADGRIYVGADDGKGRIWRINPDTGLSEASGMISPAFGSCGSGSNRHDTNSTPSIDQQRNQVYIASDDGMLHAFDLTTLAHLWGAPAGSETGRSPEDSQPAIYPLDGTVIIGSDDGKVYAVNSDGSPKWSSAACPGVNGAFVESSAAIGANGLAYIGSSCGLNAFNVANGVATWQFGSDVVEFSPMIGPDGTVYMPSESNDGPEVASLTAITQAGVGSPITVTVSANPPNAIEGGADGGFVFKRTGDTSASLTVGYNLTGTAVPGTDYDTFGTVFFAAGQTMVTKPLHALADNAPGDGETVTVVVTDGVGYSAGQPAQATVTIRESANACANAKPSSYTDREQVPVHTLNIDCITAYGLAQGFPDNTYRPTVPVTRPQMASFVARLLVKGGVPLPPNPPDAFPGDNAGPPHELAINQLAAVDILDLTTGQLGNRYDVGSNMRRDNMAQLLFNAYEAIHGAALPSGPDAFTDDNGNPNEAAINALARAGVLEGTGGGLYDPSGSVTRGQFASFFARFVQVLVDVGAMQPLPPTGP
jgi:outer membrane protein assembly factor BamB